MKATVIGALCHRRRGAATGCPDSIVSCLRTSLWLFESQDYQGGLCFWRRDETRRSLSLELETFGQHTHGPSSAVRPANLEVTLLSQLDNATADACCHNIWGTYPLTSRWHASTSVSTTAPLAAQSPTPLDATVVISSRPSPCSSRSLPA